MNGRGCWTLFQREVGRTLKFPLQVFISPLMQSALFFIAFEQVGKRASISGGLPYENFVLPGLVFISISEGAYYCSAVSLLLMRMEGSIVQLLVAPLGVTELLIAWIGGAMVRGLISGALTWVTVALLAGPRVQVSIASLGACLAIAELFAAIGIVLGIWSRDIERMQLFPIFFLTPLTFLGGVFFSTDTLTEPWRFLSNLNPLRHIVDVLRYAMVGGEVRPPAATIASFVFVTLALTVAAGWFIKSGHHLRR